MCVQKLNHSHFDLLVFFTDQSQLLRLSFVFCSLLNVSCCDCSVLDNKIYNVCVCVCVCVREREGEKSDSGISFRLHEDWVEVKKNL